ncbi:MAG: hypothetical protein U0132_15230 [Gemmatimonadaceae bacterium]
MDRYTAMVAFAGIVVGGLIILTILRGILPGAHRRLPPSSAPDALTGVSDRLDRMEGAIDAIAVEVERVAEAQRFATKLLAERAAEPVERPR